MHASAWPVQGNAVASVPCNLITQQCHCLIQECIGQLRSTHASDLEPHVGARQPAEVEVAMLLAVN